MNGIWLERGVIGDLWKEIHVESVRVEFVGARRYGDKKSRAECLAVRGEAGRAYMYDGEGWSRECAVGGGCGFVRCWGGLVGFCV